MFWSLYLGKIYVFFKNIYLFIYLFWLRQALVAAHGISVATCGIFSCGMRDLVPWPGIEPRLSALGPWSLNRWTTREVPKIYVFNKVLKSQKEALYPLAAILHPQMPQCWMVYPGPLSA